MNLKYHLDTYSAIAGLAFCGKIVDSKYLTNNFEGTKRYDICSTCLKSMAFQHERAKRGLSKFTGRVPDVELFSKVPEWVKHARKLKLQGMKFEGVSVELIKLGFKIDPETVYNRLRYDKELARRHALRQKIKEKLGAAV